MQYTIADGLPSNEIHQVVQDDRGFMWFATDRGLSRFDGYEFQNLTIQEGLASNNIILLLKDKHGRLIVESDNYMVQVLLDGKIIQEHSLLRKDDKTKKPHISAIYLDSKNQLWIDYRSSGYDYLLGHINSEGEYSTTVRDTAKRLSLVLKQVSSSDFVLQADGLFPVVKTDSKGRKTYEFPFQISYLDGRTRKLGLVNKSYILLYTESKESAHYLGGGPNVLIVKDSTLKTIQTPITTVRAITFGKSGKIWVAGNGGLLCYDSAITNNTLQSHTLVNHNISGVVEDNEGGLWVTTLNKGIVYLPTSDFATFNISETPNSEKITAIASDTGGVIHVGTENGLYKMNGNSFNPIKLESVAKPVEALGFNDHNSLFVYNYTSVLRLDGAKSHKYFEGDYYRLRELFPDEKTYQDHRTSSLDMMDMIVREDTVWFGQFHGFGAIVGDQITYLSIYDSLLLRSESLLDDGEHGLWIGSRTGLHRWNGSRLLAYGDKYSELKLPIRDLNKLSNGDLVLGTAGYGLLIYNQDSVLRIGAKDGLINDNINQVVVVSDTLWLATNTGLSRVTGIRSNPEIKNFTIANGLPSNDIRAVHASQDKIWLGTGQGLVSFTPSKLSSSTTAPNIYIESIAVNHRDTTGELTQLKYNQNVISVSYLGLCFRCLENVNYRHRLLGVNEEWTYTNKTQVLYSYLPPGQYTFSVSAQNVDGVWSKSSANFSFEISPPFWKTWWFIALSLASIALASSVIVRRKIGRVRAQGELRAQMAESELKALRAQMNPHFTFNTLNSIQNFITNNKTEDAQKYLAKFGRLMRLTLEYSTHKTITIEEELALLKIYMDLEAQRLEHSFNYEIKIDAAVDADYDRIPPMLLQPFIENAIWHGLAQKHTTGCILIELTRKDELILMAIEDDGIGRTKAAEIKSRSGKNNKSMGMTITEDRLQILNKSNANALSVKVIDLKTSEGIARGTRVELQLHMEDS